MTTWILCLPQLFVFQDLANQLHWLPSRSPSSLPVCAPALHARATETKTGARNLPLPGTSHVPPIPCRDPPHPQHANARARTRRDEYGSYATDLAMCVWMDARDARTQRGLARRVTDWWVEVRGGEGVM